MRLGNNASQFLFLFSLFPPQICTNFVSAGILGEDQSPYDAADLAEMPDCDISTMPAGVSKRGTAGIDANTPDYRYPQAPLDVEGYPVAPGNLQLEQVHVYVRHVRLTGPPACIPEYWNMCTTARRFSAAVSSMLGYAPEHVSHVDEHDYAHEETLNTRKLVERKDGTRVDGECLLGELTDLGRQSTFHFGQNLRKLYIDRLGFLPDVLTDKNMVYFRSTNVPRTTESLQQIIHGFYPTNKCHPSALPPLLLRNGKDENLIPNTYACKRLELLVVSFATAAAQAYNPSLELLDKKVSKYLNGGPIRIRAAIAHGVKVPPEFEDKSIVDVIERAVVSEWFSGRFFVYHKFNVNLTLTSRLFPEGYKTEEVRRLGMGPLLSDMTRKLQHKVLIHSTHDTALAAMASTFDVFDEKWPSFTASITFELFKKADIEPPSALHQTILSAFSPRLIQNIVYVRMRYQNKDMILPLCVPEGNHLKGHPEFCTFAAFKARVDELTPKDWDTECSPAGRG
ncbi:histidine phosphatase superfamily [Flammula alnicola]|nr:histidine phosphatase superfamily [Flammula alnicola]